MNAVKSTWRQLVRRRLWPVAVLLLAALAAVPVMLAREPEAPISPLVPSETVTSKADDAIAEPIVAEVTPEDRARRRRVLGVRKDPFRPAPARKAKVDEPTSAQQPKSEQPAETDSGSELPPVNAGGGSTSGGEPAAEKTYYAPGTIVVRFGEASSDSLTRLAINKLEPVPDPEFPMLVYMGLTKDGKRARFMIDAAIEVDGDGECKPHPANCEVMELAVGETEFLDVVNPEPAEEPADPDGTEETEETEEEAAPEIVAQFRLDLVDIKRAGDHDVR